MPFLPGFTKRKGVTLYRGATHQFGDWVQFDLTDPDLVALPTGDGDVAVTRQSDDLRLPIAIISRTADRIRIAVALPAPTTAGQTVACWAYTKAGGSTAWAPTVWAPEGVVSGTAGVGPVIDIRDGNGNTIVNNDDWIHPNAMRVDQLTGAKAWLKYKNAAERDAGVGTVTHIRIDTPLPGNVQYENPYLFYSTDNGLTWVEWHGTLNPIEPGPGAPAFNSDPTFAVKANGGLYCLWRYDDGGTVSDFRTRTVTGTHLGDAAVGVRSDAVLGGGLPILSPTLAVVSSTEWYLFHVRSDTKAWYRRLSTDEGATWGAATVAIASGNANTALNSEADRRYWHGGVSASAIGGYWYLLTSETAGNTQTNLDMRLFRTTDPSGAWEPTRLLPIVRTASTWTADTCYQGNIFEKTDGSTAAILSGQHTSGSPQYRVGVVALDVEQEQTLTIDQAFKWGVTFTSKYADPPTVQRAYDLGEGPNSGLNDLSGNAGTLSVLAGAPVYTAGEGYEYNGNDLHDTGFDPGGLGFWELEVEYTITAAMITALGNALGPVTGIIGPADNRAFRALEVVGNVSPDYLRSTVYFSDGAVLENTAAGAPQTFDATRRTILLRYDGTNLRFYLDGDEYRQAPKSGGLLKDINIGFTLGGYPNPFTTSNYQFGHCKLHRWSFRSYAAAPRIFDEFAPIARWTVGNESGGATVVDAAVAFSGTGTLSPTAKLASVAAVSLSGAGTFAAAGETGTYVDAAAAFVGAAAFTVTPHTTVRAAAAWAGRGTFSAGTAAPPPSAALLRGFLVLRPTYAGALELRTTLDGDLRIA